MGNNFGKKIVWEIEKIIKGKKLNKKGGFASRSPPPIIQ